MDNVTYIPPPPTTSLADYPVNFSSKLRRPRSANRSSNGTLTFRRSSTTPNAQSSSQGDSALLTPNMETSDQAGDTRYAKNQILEVYNQHQAPDPPNGDVNVILDPNWDPVHSNGTSGRGWIRSSDSGDTHGPYGCWDQNGDQRPIALEAMTDSERLVSFPQSVYKVCR